MTPSLPRKLFIAAISLFVLGPLAALATVSGHAQPASHGSANFACMSIDQANLGLCLQPPIAGH